MRALNLTTVYAVFLVFCLLTPRIATATTSFSKEEWMLCLDWGEEEPEEENQEKKGEAEFYFSDQQLAVAGHLTTPAELPVRIPLIESLYHPEVFAPPPEFQL